MRHFCKGNVELPSVVASVFFIRPILLMHCIPMLPLSLTTSFVVTVTNSIGTITVLCHDTYCYISSKRYISAVKGWSSIPRHVSCRKPTAALYNLSSALVIVHFIWALGCQNCSVYNVHRSHLSATSQLGRVVPSNNVQFSPRISTALKTPAEASRRRISRGKAEAKQ